MFSTFTRRHVAGVVALALGTSLTTVPAALAENVEQEVSLPLSCNVKGDIGSTANVYTHPSYPEFISTIKTSAPTTVLTGESFEYKLLPSTLTFPNKLGGFFNSLDVAAVSQVNLWIDLPEHAELQEDGIVVEGANKDDFKVTVEDGRLHIAGSGDDAKDVTTWTGTGYDSWQAGGLATQVNTGNKAFEVQTPTITLKLTANNDAGETIQPTIKATTAKDFSAESFYQLFASSQASGGDAKPMFVRCSPSPNDPGSFPAVTIEAVTKEVTGEVTLTDPQGKPLAAGSEVKLLVNGEEFSYPVTEGAILEITREVAVDSQEDLKIAFADNPEGAVTLTLAGSQTENVKAELAQKAYPAPVQVKVIEEDGTPVAKDTKVSLIIDGGKAQNFSVDDKGFVTVTADLAIGQMKTVKVALASAPEATVEAKLTGSVDAEPVVADGALKRKAADNGGDDKEGSSVEDLANPATWAWALDLNIWASVLAAVLGLQAVVYILQTIGEFAKPLFR